MSVIIRPADPSEYTRLGQIALSSYRALGGMPHDHWYLDEVADVAGRATDTVTLAAVVDGRLAGVVTYVPGHDTSMSEFDDPDAAGMRMLAVDPAFQRQGIGAALVLACLDRARADGRRRLILHSSQIQTGAQAMYRVMGFRHEPTLDWDPAEGVHLTGYIYDL